MKYIKFLGNSKYLVPEDWNVSNYKYYSFTKTLPDESTTTGIYKTRGLVRNGKLEIIITKEGGVSKKEYAFIDSKSNIYDTSGNKVGTVVSEAYQDPANGHEYVEIGGIKWATMNIGAKKVTDAGLYFQWGDIQGYTADQVGNGEGQKKFDWISYKYGYAQDMFSQPTVTKYNSTDNKTTLDVEDDAAQQLLGGSWRMPTSDEFALLKESTNIEWTLMNGVYGILCVDKLDSSKTLFFPAIGMANGSQISYIGENGNYWTNSKSSYGENREAVRLRFYNDGSFYPVSQESRVNGYPIRAVLDYQEEQETPPTPSINNNGYDYIDLGLPSGTLWATTNVGASSETDYGNYYMYGMGSKTYDSTDTPYDGTEDPLDLSKDTARVVCGGDWHMPTSAQMEELTDNTTYQWVTNYNGSGINGGTFTATNGAVLFLPAAGYWYNGSQSEVGNCGLYWSSSPGDDDANYPYYLNFDNNRTDVANYLERNNGLLVRPVIG